MRSGSAVSASSFIAGLVAGESPGPLRRGTGAWSGPVEDLRLLRRRDGRGKAAYHPVMMVRVLLYGYCVGVTGSRRIERASYDDIAFRYLCGDQHPDHDSI